MLSITLMNVEELNLLLKMSLTELNLYRFNFKDSFCFNYAEGLIYYLEGNVDQLQNKIHFIQKTSLELSEKKLLLQLLTLRLQVRNKQPEIDNILTLKKLLYDQVSSPALQGEIHFILGMAFEELGNDYLSSEHYNHSYQIFEQAKIAAKSMKALHNYIASQSRIPEFKNRNYISEYKHLYLLCLKQKDFLTAGTCLTNVGMEQMNLKLLNEAKHTFERALKLLENNITSHQYYLTLLKYTETIKQLNQIHNYQYLKNLIITNPFPDLNILTEIVLKYFDSQLLDSSNRLSYHEELLIKLLLEGPKDKAYLLDSLYGKNLNYFTRDNRFKNLLIRIKKKKIYSLNLKNGKYTIAS